MKVYSLVGKSGTGKSYRAGEICNRYGIDGVIDDGLFILNGRILAGTSAKRQNTKVRAIKTALFTDDTIRDKVAGMIRRAGPSSVLVIGTSDRMVGIIADRLGLPAPEVRFDIEDLTTPDERDAAYRQRHELGKHVIPAPTFQIKKTFSGYFYHPIRTLIGMADARLRERDTDQRPAADTTPGADADEPRANTPAAQSGGRIWDRSVVRPTYSYLGDFTISDKAVRDIVRSTGRMVDGVDEAPFILVHTHRDGVIIEIGAIMRYGARILDAARKLQTMAAANLEEMTSINVVAVDVEIRGLTG
jgi:uncharacterized alkaline shock family protein YloU